MVPEYDTCEVTQANPVASIPAGGISGISINPVDEYHFRRLCADFGLTEVQDSVIMFLCHREGVTVFRRNVDEPMMTMPWAV